MFVELTVPLGGLGLLEGHTLPEGTRVEFERTASVGGRDSSSLLISGDVRGVTTAVRESRFVADVTRVGDTDHETVYRLTWAESLPELLDLVHDVGGTVLTAVATDDAWTVELRFPDPDAASRFYTLCDDPAHRITIRRMRPAGRAQQKPGDALSPAQREALGRALEAGYFSGLEWLGDSALPDDDTEIGRLLLVDRETILVSSFVEAAEDGREHEQAVFGRGFDNGLVAITRRLMATGLRPGDDPETGVS